MSLTAPTVTGWSTFWSQIAPTGQGAAYSMAFARSAPERMIARILKKEGMRELHRDWKVLTGAASGSSASETYTRVKGEDALNSFGLTGGVRNMETVTVISRNTTAADITYITNNILDAIYNMAPAIASYPVDASGNGGGGRVGK